MKVCIKNLFSLRRSGINDSPVHITSGGRVYVDPEKQLRTPEAQEIMRRIQARFKEKASSGKDDKEKKD